MKQVWAHAPDHAVIEQRVHALERHVAAITEELAALRATVNDLSQGAVSPEGSAILHSPAQARTPPARDHRPREH